jgi:hypothetical protein
MQFENPMTFVRSLKGAPVSILMAFFFARKALTALELRMWTGYQDEAITVSLRLLVDLGWLTARSARGPWCLTEGRQLPLMNLLENETLNQDESGLTGFSPDSSSSSSSKLNIPTIEEEEEEDHESGLTGFVANKKALEEAGIREPARSRLAKLAHVNPEMIAAHVEQARAEGWEIGTAIYRIEYDWPLPERKLGDRVITSGSRRNQVTLIVPADIVREVAGFTGHRLECSCMDCAIGRTQGISQLCPDCKHYRCECEESENE